MLCFCWGGTIADGTIRYERLTLKAEALREELHTQVEKMLNDVIRFKVNVQEGIEGFDAFVVGELESELGGQDECEAEAEAEREEGEQKEEARDE